jgi:hypothetical protein
MDKNVERFNAANALAAPKCLTMSFRFQEGDKVSYRLSGACHSSLL